MKEFVFTAVCPHCGTKNRVAAIVADDGENGAPFEEDEDFHCAYCGLKIGETVSAAPVRTETIEGEG